MADDGSSDCCGDMNSPSPATSQSMASPKTTGRRTGRSTIDLDATVAYSDDDFDIHNTAPETPSAAAVAPRRLLETPLTPHWPRNKSVLAAAVAASSTPIAVGAGDCCSSPDAADAADAASAASTAPDSPGTSATSKEGDTVPGPWRAFPRLWERLYPHQREGIRWMWGLHEQSRPGGILADDMGLGKTVQVSAFLKGVLTHPRKRTPSSSSSPVAPLASAALIIVPLALLGTWQAEIRKWCGHKISCWIFHGQTQRKRVQALRMMAANGGVMITT